MTLSWSLIGGELGSKASDWLSGSSPGVTRDCDPDLQLSVKMTASAQTLTLHSLIVLSLSVIYAQAQGESG